LEFACTRERFGIARQNRRNRRIVDNIITDEITCGINVDLLTELLFPNDSHYDVTPRAERSRAAASRVQEETRSVCTQRLTFLLDHIDLIVDLLTQQDRVQVVEKGLQMLRSIAERNDYGDTMPGDAVRGLTLAAHLHLHE